MTVAASTPQAQEAGHRIGFETLDAERRVDDLPVEGALPEWLQGSLLRIGPARYEVGDRTVNHWFDGFSMLHRFGFTDGRVSYANRFSREPGPPSCEGHRGDLLLGVRNRSVPVDLQAGAGVLQPEDLRQRERQPHPPRRGRGRDDRDSAAGRLRPEDARERGGRLPGPRPAHDRASASRPGHRRRPLLRGEVRAPNLLPPLRARRRPSASGRSRSCRFRACPICTASGSPSATRCSPNARWS